MIKQIIGPHIVIRKAKPSDLESIYYNVYSDADLLKLMLFRVSPSLEEAKDRLEKTIKFQSDKDLFFVALKDTDEAIGLCGVIKMDELEGNIYSEGGLAIAKKYQGRGYATEMLSMLMDVAFTKYQADAFMYSYFEGNEQSKGLCNHFDFKFFDTIKQVRPEDKKEFTAIRSLIKKEDYQGINFDYQIIE